MASTARPTTREGLALRKLTWVGPLTIVVTALVNLLIRSIAVALFGSADSFTYLRPPFVIGSTIVFLALAILAFVLVGRFSNRPVRAFRLVAIVALLISFLNPLMLLAGFVPATGMSLHIFWTMIAMHCVSALITVSTLTRLAAER